MCGDLPSNSNCILGQSIRTCSLRPIYRNAGCEQPLNFLSTSSIYIIYQTVQVTSSPGLLSYWIEHLTMDWRLKVWFFPSTIAGFLSCKRARALQCIVHRNSSRRLPGFNNKEQAATSTSAAASIEFSWSQVRMHLRWCRACFHTRIPAPRQEGEHCTVHHIPNHPRDHNALLCRGPCHLPAGYLPAAVACHLAPHVAAGLLALRAVPCCCAGLSTTANIPVAVEVMWTSARLVHDMCVSLLFPHFPFSTSSHCSQT